MKKIIKIGKIVGAVLAGILVVAVAFITLYKPFGKSPNKAAKEAYAKRTDAFYDGTFHGNPEISVMNNAKSEFSGDEERVPKGEIPVVSLDSIKKAKEDELKWLWFGHSSSLLQIQGMNVLIDPVFSDYTSPVQGFGMKRFSKPPIAIENMPEIDALVISHDHYDHLDYDTIMKMDSKVKEYFVPLGVENHLIYWGIREDKIHTMAWWDEITTGKLKITSAPGRHFTGRLPWTANTTLWSGYVFEGDKYTVYYTGDTGYGDFFKEIHNRFENIDLMITENGQYDKSWEAIHLLPKKGIQAIKDINPAWVVPVHWGTFSISYHAWDDPIKQITTRAQKENIQVATPKIGEIVDYSQISSFQEKWWEKVE